MKCPKCCLQLCCESDNSIMCEGSCFQSYHAECVGLSEAIVRCLSKNIIWLCDDCLASFYKQNNPMKSPAKEPTEFDLELAEVKDKISNIMETLSSITPQLPMSQQKETFCSIQCTARHSTPMSSPPLCSGSKLEYGSSIELSSGSKHSGEENSFSLFLTNIDGSATEQEVSDMVAQSLGINEMQRIEVLKLVPKWRMHYYKPPYVSFKITMDQRFRRTALQSETWPAGIMFREFIEQPRRIWIPFRQKQNGQQ